MRSIRAAVAPPTLLGRVVPLRSEALESDICTIPRADSWFQRRGPGKPVGVPPRGGGPAGASDRGIAPAILERVRQGLGDRSRVLLCLALCLYFVGTAHAAPYIVGVFPNSPRMLEVGPSGEYGGFEMDVWAEVARRLSIAYRFEESPTAAALLKDLSAGRYDFGLGNVAIADDGSGRIFFSHPYLATGQAIMVHVRERRPLAMMWLALQDPVVLSALELFLGFSVVFGHMLWLVERGGPSGIDRRYLPGIFGASWCVFNVKAGIGLGDFIPRLWISRLLCVPVWVMGMLLISVITAHFITQFNREAEASPIHDKADLVGKRVVTVDGTPSVDIARALYPSHLVTTAHLSEACHLLETGKVDAVVYDYLVLAQAADRMRNAGLPVALAAARPFNQQFYAIAVSRSLVTRDPALAHALDRIVSDMVADGFLERTREKWFSAPSFGTRLPPRQSSRLSNGIALADPSRTGNSGAMVRRETSTLPSANVDI